MANREKRLERIAELLATNHVTSQEQIRSLLLADGFDATQATVSRDLRELGVVKKESGYALPQGRRDTRRAIKELASALRGKVVSAQRAGTLVVLKTEPGVGPAVATAIDAAGIPASAGTIASHDTVFIASHSSPQARQLVRQIMAWTKLV